MKNNDYTYKTPEQQDDFIQSLSISDIKKHLMGGELVLRSEDIKRTQNIDNEYLESDFEIQRLTISELLQKIR